MHFCSHLSFTWTAVSMHTDKCLTFIYMGEADAVIVTIRLKWNINDCQLAVSDIIETVLIPIPVVTLRGERLAGTACEHMNRVLFL